MNLACLIGRKGQAAFEQTVFSAAREFSDAYTFDMTARSRRITSWNWTCGRRRSAAGARHVPD